MNETEVQSTKVDSAESKANGFNRANFSIASLADEDRRYLGVLVTNEKTEVTNGHYLLRVTTPDLNPEDYPTGPNGHKPIDKDFRCILSKDSAKQIEKAIPRGPKVGSLPILKNTWVVDDNEETIGFVATDLDTWSPITARKVDGRWPNTDNDSTIWPKDEPVLEIGFNLEYLEKLCKEMKSIIGKSKSNPLAKFTFYGSEKPVKIEADNLDTGQDVTALLMPCKF